MPKIIATFLFIISFASLAAAENKIKRVSIKTEPPSVPKSAKLEICKESDKKYSIISSDYCRVIKDRFNSITKDE